MTTPEPKHCPFCGSTKTRVAKNFIVNDSGLVESISTHVSCIKCGADGPKIAYVENVIEAWNERKN